MDLHSLLSNKQFISEIIPLESVEEVQTAFKERDVELTIEQCEELGAEIKRIITVNDNELEQMSGGGKNKFLSSLSRGMCLTPIGETIDVVDRVKHSIEWETTFNPFNMVGGIIGSGISLAATIGAYELIKFAGKKVGNWIKDRKTKSCEGT